MTTASGSRGREGRSDCWLAQHGGSRRRRFMKGQAVFEFVVATLFFLGIVMYTINSLNTSVGTYSGEHRENVLEINAWRVSEILARSPGIWSGSGGTVPESLGLANEWPVMNESKMGSLVGMCATDMAGVERLLDIDPMFNEIAVRIGKKAGSGEVLMLECGDVPQGVPYSMVTRFGVSGTDGRLLKMDVWYY